MTKRTRKIQGGSHQTRAMFQPSTINEAERTVEVTFVTENKVRNYPWFDEPFDEILSLESSHIRSARMDAGLPVLDNHNRWGGALGTIGVLENVRLIVENGMPKGVGTLRFSKREEVAGIFQDIKDGIVRGISVGYRVFKYMEENPNRKADEIKVLRAIDWEPYEVSVAPIQADVLSAVRAAGDQQHEIVIEGGESARQQSTTNQSIMKREEVIALLKERGIAFDENATDAQLIELVRKAMEKTPSADPKENAPTDPVEAARAAVAAERTRVTSINDAVRKAGLEPAFAEEHVGKGSTIDEVRAAIIDKLAERQPDINGHGRITVGKEHQEKVREQMADAITLRAEPGVKLDADANKNAQRIEAARTYRGLRLLDMARVALEEIGVNTRGMSERQIAEAAMNLGERTYHSSSDFPIILGNTVNRSLRRAYELQPRTFSPFVRRVNLSDFREVTRTQLSGLMSGFDTIAEGGEYKGSTLSEAKESFKLAKYGKKITITWEALINDDLDAFSRIPAAIAAKAAQKQSDIVYGILLGNPAMGDGTALFHSSHGNLGTASAINEAGLSAARKAMRTQKDINGDFINVSSSFMLVGPDKETEAQKLLNATIVATKTADTNIFANSHTLIVEPRITGNKWFLAATPNLVDTIEIGFLDGEPELFTEQRTGFDVDGLEIKARMVFAAKAIDWRGMYYNPGA